MAKSPDEMDREIDEVTARIAQGEREMAEALKVLQDFLEGQGGKDNLTPLEVE